MRAKAGDDLSKIFHQLGLVSANLDIKNQRVNTLAEYNPFGRENRKDIRTCSRVHHHGGDIHRGTLNASITTAQPITAQSPALAFDGELLGTKLKLLTPKGHWPVFLYRLKLTEAIQKIDDGPSDSFKQCHSTPPFWTNSRT
jgi:hypothetical protein